LDDVPLREETVPIHDIRVTFHNGLRIRRVLLEPGRVECEQLTVVDGVSIVVPRLDVHMMVVAELEPMLSR
jgi:hypothetical protein